MAIVSETLLVGGSFIRRRSVGGNGSDGSGEGSVVTGNVNSANSSTVNATIDMLHSQCLHSRRLILIVNVSKIWRYVIFMSPFMVRDRHEKTRSWE